MKCVFAILAFAAVVSAEKAGGCPLHTVLDLLDKMNIKIKAEGAEADKVHKETTEWCRSTVQDTEHNIARNNDAVAKYSATLEKANAEIEALSARIEELAAQISQEMSNRDKAVALRKQQNTDFQKGQSDIEATIDQLIRAAGILRKAGLGGAPMKAALMQVTQTLKTVLDAAFINSHNRNKLQALLQSATDSEGFEEPEAKAYESHSGDIIEVVNELKVQAEGELSDLRNEEMKRQHEFDMLKQGLDDSIATAERDRKNANRSLKENQETAAKSSGSLAAEKDSLSTNSKYLADTNAECAQKDDDFSAATKSRSEELAALAKAEDIIRDTYKGAVKEFHAGGHMLEHEAELPGFLQILSPREDARSQAVRMIRGLARQFRSVAFSQLAARAGDDTFGKVKGLVRNMIAKLKKQAAAEGDHHAYCVSERKENVAKRDDRQNKLESFSARLESSEAQSKQLKQDISDLSSEVAELDSQMGEATKIRQQEASDYGHAAEGFRIADEGLTKAIEVLRNYYSAAGAHDKKTDSANGIVSMLEVLLQDCANMAAQAESAENNAQTSYDKMMQEGKISKAQKQASIKAKQGEDSRLTQIIADLQNDVDGSQAELDATLAYLAKLKGMCTHKPQSFADRAAAMQKEIAGLKQALEILSNESSASFLQRN